MAQRRFRRRRMRFRRTKPDRGWLQWSFQTVFTFPSNPQPEATGDMTLLFAYEDIDDAPDAPITGDRSDWHVERFILHATGRLATITSVEGLSTSRDMWCSLVNANIDSAQGAFPLASDSFNWHNTAHQNFKGRNPINTYFPVYQTQVVATNGNIADSHWHGPSRVNVDQKQRWALGDNEGCFVCFTPFWDSLLSDYPGWSANDNVLINCAGRALLQKTRGR